MLILVLLLVTCHLLGHLPPALAEVTPPLLLLCSSSPSPLLLSSLLQVLANLVGTVLLLVVGGLCMAYYTSLNHHYNNNKTVSGQGTYQHCPNVATGIHLHKMNTKIQIPASGNAFNASVVSQ